MTKVSSIEELLKSFENYMNEVNWKKYPYSLYAPVEYILTMGGKKIRPLSVVYVSEVLSGNKQAALAVAYGLELFHNFTLMHDDIMDQASLRRSQETAHKKFGVNMAILSGDVLMIESLKYLRLAEVSSACNTLQDSFIQTAKEVCEGQAMDMEFELKQEISYPEYLEMIRLKTAVLLAFGLKAAALISNRDDLQESLYNIGIYTGLVFQLQDDLLDFYGENNFGKQKAGDIIQSKKSALILELLDQFSELEKNQFIGWYHQSQEKEKKISLIQEYFDKFQIRQKLEARINNLHTKSLICIEKMDIHEDQKSHLSQFIINLFQRTN